MTGLARGLAAIRPQHVMCAVGLALAWGLANAFGWWIGNATRDLAQTSAHFVYEALLPMLVLVVTIALADAATQDTPTAIAPYAIAAITAAIAGEILFTATAPLLGIVQCYCSMDRWEPGARTANMLPDSLLICGFVTAGYRYRRRTSQRLSRIRARELDRAQLTRRMVESRLQAMQACIEPQFLFDTLGAVERLHQVQPRTAIRLIDELIVYLRAALPHLRESTSTMAKEAELAHAWFNIRQLRSGQAMELVVDIAPGAAEAGMPPMVLLPLVDYMLGADAAPDATAHLRVAARVGEGRLVATLTGHGLANAAEQAPAMLQRVRERLATLYPDQAFLTLGTDARGNARILLDIPHERTYGHHR